MQLQEQPFLVLRMLIEHARDILTREEIKQTLWLNDTVVEFDSAINTVISNLRRALGDSAVDARYIETIGRRGYRLVVLVDWIVEPEPAAAIARTEPPSAELSGRECARSAAGCRADRG